MPLLEASPDRIAAAARRVMARCDELARVSAQSGAIERVYLSPEHARVNRLAAEWMREVGLRTWQDAAGNQLGRIERSADPDPAAPALMIGSHLDTVKDAGRFDGIIGVLMALEVVRLLRQESEGVSRVPLPFAVEVAAFSDEEGTRFGKALLGSSAVAGTWNDAWWTLADEDGVTLRQAFLEFGLDPGRIGEAARRPDHLVAYLEAHIEQGPVLEADGLAVGTVTGIAAQLRYAVTVKGMAGHAGTTAMRLRRDPLAGAAAMVLAVEQIARGDNSDVVATVGVIEAMPGAPNVIPGAVHFTIDVRSGKEERRDCVAEAILARLSEIAEARDLEISVERVHDLPASPCDADLMDLMDEALIGAGQPVRRLVSGAGHDAMNMAALCPTAMLFIRCKGGVSHNPAEHVEPEDVEIALQVMLGFIERLGTRAGDRNAA